MKTFFLIVVSCLFVKATAQELTLLDQKVLPPYETCSIDPYGNLYLGDANGRIIRIKDFEEDLTYAPPKPASISLLDASHSLRLFIFYGQIQEYTYLNRQLTTSGNFRFNDPAIGYVLLACPSFDNQIWLIDQSDFSLKKYNITLQKTALSTSLELILDRKAYQIACIREYQNKLFISEANSGIHMFDNLGNYIKSFTEPGIQYFNFSGDSIYYAKNDQLHTLNLYTEQSTSMKLPSEAYKYVLLYKDQILLLTDTEISVFKR